MRTHLISGLFAGVAAIVMIAGFHSAKAGHGESYLLMTVLASALGRQRLRRLWPVFWPGQWSGAIFILVMVANYLIGRYQARRRTV
jgi:ribose/xylose/arabinose/galactoside ABC-type transport system permease subunit